MICRDDRIQITLSTGGSNDKIRLFMYAVGAVLNKVDPSLGDLYYNAKDEQSLLKWSNKTSSTVWTDIEHFYKKRGTTAFCPWVRPFCVQKGIVNNPIPIILGCCYRCEYAKNHNARCSSPHADITKIRLLLAARDSHPTLVLTDSVYAEIFRRVELEYGRIRVGIALTEDIVRREDYRD